MRNGALDLRLCCFLQPRPIRHKKLARRLLYFDNLKAARTHMCVVSESGDLLRGFERSELAVRHCERELLDYGWDLPHGADELVLRRSIHGPIDFTGAPMRNARPLVLRNASGEDIETREQLRDVEKVVWRQEKRPLALHEADA